MPSYLHLTRRYIVLFKSLDILVLFSHKTFDTFLFEFYTCNNYLLTLTACIPIFHVRIFFWILNNNIKISFLPWKTNNLFKLSRNIFTLIRQVFLFCSKFQYSSRADWILDIGLLFIWCLTYWSKYLI